MKLKMHVASKNFEKICLKAIRDPFFKYVVCDQGKNDRTQFFGGRCNLQKSKVQAPHKDNPNESAWSVYCNNSENSEWEYFSSKQQIYSMHC